MLSRIILIFGLTLPLAACGGDDEQVQEPPAQEQVEPPPPFVAPVAPAPEPEPEPLSGPLYTIQMGAFLNADSAAVLRDGLDCGRGRGRPTVSPGADRCNIDRFGGQAPRRDPYGEIRVVGLDRAGDLLRFRSRWCHRGDADCDRRLGPPATVRGVGDASMVTLVCAEQGGLGDRL